MLRYLCSVTRHPTFSIIVYMPRTLFEDSNVVFTKKAFSIH